MDVTQGFRLFVCLLGLLFAALPGAIAAPGEAAGASEPDGSERPASLVTERVTVTASRLADGEAAEEQLPAHVTVIDREELAEGGYRTLQDLLLFESGVVVHDSVGNDIQKTLDLRGFTGGGTKVFLNGAPINDPRNNSVSLEMIPPSALDNLQITRGAAAATVGGGSQAGVIQLETRRGEEGIEGVLSLERGEFDTGRYSGGIWGGTERFDYFLSGSLDDTDGFRENAGGDLQRFTGSFGIKLNHDRRLDLSLLSSKSALGNPGALTEAELADDPTQAPYNELDFFDQDHDQLSLNFTGTLTGSFSIAANLFYRDRTSESLTTGRAAASFGGFDLQTDEASLGSTLQVTHAFDGERFGNRLVMGVEWLDGDTDALGISTPAGDAGAIDPANVSSDNTTARTTSAIFIQDTWQVAPRLSLLAGARADRDELGYDERFPATDNAGERTFSEMSLRAGVNWSVSERHGIYASYGDSFLPPTVEQLYAFPTFGSNPELDPEDSASLEIGYRGRWSNGLRLDAAAFQIDTEDEIVFDPDSDLGLFGANVNAGETRRRGVEAAFNAQATKRLSFFANLTLLDATFRNGEHRGNAVPLVPEEQLSAGLDARLPAGFRHVGEQVLDNDDANEQQALDSYTVANLRLSWSLNGLTFFTELLNLFDEQYATRGIYAFDFSTFQNDVFLAPAPGRRFLAGVEWRF